MLTMPTVHGLIDRRILVNFRVDPDLAEGCLPPPFRPQLVGGHAIGGICLIRLSQLRPSLVPAAFGLASENAAHRFAVEWEEQGRLRRGVYIPRRDTSSRFNVLAGGRFFPGTHHLADFDSRETDQRWRVSFRGRDGGAHASIDAAAAEEVPAGSVFGSVEQAAEFFRQGADGFSPARRPGSFDALRLQAEDWSLTPLHVGEVASSYFDDLERFPAGTVAFDSAFLMRRIAHRWVTLPRLTAGEVARERPEIAAAGAVSAAEFI
jgi:hypothetical protein